jgi:hypothetical protein
MRWFLPLQNIGIAHYLAPFDQLRVGKAVESCGPARDDAGAKVEYL